MIWRSSAIALARMLWGAPAEPAPPGIRLPGKQVMPAANDVTRILERMAGGERHLAEDLLPLIYSELRSLARARMAAERAGHTLQPTALVHEAYIRLVGEKDVSWDNRGHFFAAAAESMRRILVERARARNRYKRGGDLRRTTLHEGELQIGDDSEQLLDLDRALTGLEARDAQMAAVVKLRYFAGLSVEEAAAALSVSPRTINRSWLAAKAWLATRIE